MKSCPVYCFSGYFEENPFPLLLTSAVMVLTLCVCFTRKRKARSLSRKKAKTRLDEHAGGSKHGGHGGLGTDDGGKTLVFTPIEDAIEMLSLEMARQCFGSSAYFYRRPPVWFLPRSRIQPPGGHKTEEKTFRVQESKSGGGASRPESYYKKRPSKMKFKRTVRLSDREQSLSLSSILAVGPVNVMGLQPPVCIPKSRKCLLKEAEMFLMMQHRKSREQRTLPMDQSGVPAMEYIQDGVKVTLVRWTTAEPRERSPSRPQARSTKPRPSPESLKSRPALKRRPESDRMGKKPAMTGKSGQHRGGDRVKTAQGSAKKTEIETQFSSFVKGLQKRLEEVLKL